MSETTANRPCSVPGCPHRGTPHEGLPGAWCPGCFAAGRQRLPQRRLSDPGRARLCVNVLAGFSDEQLRAILAVADGNAAARYAALCYDAAVLCVQNAGKVPDLRVFDEPDPETPVPEPRCQCGATPIFGLGECEECHAKECVG